MCQRLQAELLDCGCVSVYLISDLINITPIASELRILVTVLHAVALANRLL